MNQGRKIRVRIRENAWLARLSARKLGFTHVAMVIGSTIYLYNTSISDFKRSKRWVIHELMHVEQFRRHGFLLFLILYGIEYLRNGYYQNKFEIEARNAENDTSLLERYE